MHPDYNQNSFDHDVALIRLNEAVTSIPPVQLKRVGFGDFQGSGVPVTALGWGLENSEAYHGSDVLLKGQVNLINRDQCRSDYSYSRQMIEDTMICAIGDGVDSCQGDSGGPLYQESTGLQVGVVSWGVGCAEEGYPGVYADVGLHYPWIAAIAGLSLADDTTGSGYCNAADLADLADELKKEQRMLAEINALEIQLREASCVDYFTVVTGPCTATGKCVSSPNFPSSYGNNEACSIRANFPGDLEVLNSAFSTEPTYDQLTVGSTPYDGTSGPNGGSIDLDTLISWSTDGSVTGSGWKICLSLGA